MRTIADTPDETTPTDPMRVMNTRVNTPGSGLSQLSSRSSRLSWPAAIRDIVLGAPVLGICLWVLYRAMEKDGYPPWWLVVAPLGALGMLVFPVALLSALGKASGAAAAKFGGGK